jgi:hypothetical protein
MGIWHGVRWVFLSFLWGFMDVLNVVDEGFLRMWYGHEWMDGRMAFAWK